MTLDLDEDVARRAEAAAVGTGQTLEAVIERALAVHLGLEALERAQAVFDLDPDEADRIAYEELKAHRAGQ